jgi:hypothetical protein
MATKWFASDSHKEAGEQISEKISWCATFLLMRAFLVGLTSSDSEWNASTLRWTNLLN